jgi:iron complex outermembrane recepter protein
MRWRSLLRRHGRRGLGTPLVLMPLVLIATAARAANPAEVLELPQVQVVGTTLLPGSAVPLAKLPANAQLFTSKDLKRQGSTSLTDFLEANATGLTVNAAQGNPHQPDINVRGFSASPLLGTPQGISVFFDGVRVNEPFGDSVNWDLIPASAISSIQLIPGSNPAFGLNTLGGAIAVYTKSGSSEYPQQPGGSVSASGGSFGRRTLGFEAGGKAGAAGHDDAGTWDWFATINDSRDHGWAQHNASHVRQAFAKLGWQNDTTDLDLSLQWADNRLEGTQTLPQSFTDPREAYTWPDRNINRVAALALKGSVALSDVWLLSGNVYVRRFRNRNLASNVNDAFVAGDMVQAVNDASTIDQLGRGAGVQLTRSGPLGGLLGGFKQRLLVGASVDDGRARFTRSSQDATFTPDRGTQALGAFTPDTDSDSTTRHTGVFASDSVDLTEHWALALSGRFNRADVTITDRSGSAPQLNGVHRFERFNPAVGISFNPSAALTAYANYGEGMRAPTAIELTCADPNDPCKLPNNFLADPPLKKVVSQTLEAGMRGSAEGGLAWSAAVFRTDLHDDLQFISANGVAVNAGYFQNVGTTRRQGVELDLRGRIKAVTAALHYSFVAATYRTGFTANSPANSSADANGAISVQRGNRIPGVARHSLKLRLDADATSDWRIGVSLLMASAVHARGDENNLDANGRVPGYAVVNLDTRWQLTRQVSIFARIDNALDRRYANFGVTGLNVFTGPARSFDASNPRAEQFRGFGAPRGAWVGVQSTF